jgi:hypothetical protein
MDDTEIKHIGAVFLKTEIIQELSQIIEINDCIGSSAQNLFYQFIMLCHLSSDKPVFLFPAFQFSHRRFA